MKHTSGFAAYFILLSTLLLGACERASETASPAPVKQPPAARIQWFDGSVDQAFALAGREHRPIYLYWGASWCPPCQEIKHTVFLDPDFIALSRLFVPVYLDGDSAQAQQAGDRFKVRGYPTMIVFNPQGTEITRIPGGIDIARYNTVLQLSLDQMRPVSELVQLALSDPARLGAGDFFQLAYYSWSQDAAALPAGTPASLFRDLAERAPDELAAARLYMQYLVSLQDEPPAEREATAAGAGDAVRRVLASDELTLGCWDTLAYRPEILELVIAEGAAGASLSSLWETRVLGLRHHPSLSTSEQLAGWLPYLHFHFRHTEEPLSAEVREDLEADLSHADHVTTDAHARQSVVSQMEYVYQQARLMDAARNLLLAELERAAEPYYFMSGLGAIAEEEGRADEAVDWYRQAYEASRGEATRLQWGASYVRALIRMTPDDTGAVAGATATLLDEVERPEELFSGRNFRVLRSLDQTLAGWQSGTGSATIAAGFHSRIADLCTGLPAASPQRENCLSLAGAPAG